MHEELSVLALEEKPLDLCQTWLPLALKNNLSQTTHSNTERRLGRDNYRAKSSGFPQQNQVLHWINNYLKTGGRSATGRPDPAPRIRRRAAWTPRLQAHACASPTPRPRRRLFNSPSSASPDPFRGHSPFHPASGILVNELYFIAVCG